MGLIQSVKGLKNKDWSFPKKEFCLQTTTQKFCLSYQPSDSRPEYQVLPESLDCHLTLWISDLLGTVVVWANSLKSFSLSLSICLYLYLYLYPIGAVFFGEPWLVQILVPRVVLENQNVKAECSELGNLNAMGIIVSQHARGWMEAFNCWRQDECGYFNRKQSQNSNQNSLTQRYLWHWWIDHGIPRSEMYEQSTKFLLDL